MNRRTDLALATIVSVCGAGFFTMTALSQHPNSAFDCLRRLDRIGFAIPNWRFFAPEPAMNDFHILHRTLDVSDVESPWQETHVVTPRKLRHLVWFPDRRRDKGLFDVVSEVVGSLGNTESAILASHSYRVLTSFVRRHVEETTKTPLQGFQILLARSTGYDESTAPEEILVTPFIPWEPVRA